MILIKDLNEYNTINYFFLFLNSSYNIIFLKFNNLDNPILVTGGAGFIGSNLVRYFVKKKKKVYLILKKSSNTWRINDIINELDISFSDLNNKKKLKTIIKRIKPKTIFHLSTNGSYPDQNNLHKIKQSNLDSTINLINECKKYGFRSFINTGSSSEYGFKNKSMKETDVLVPNSYYSVFKSASTLFCQYESINNDLPITTVRPFHVYGPFERETRLIPTLIHNMINEKKINLVSPKISRDLVYVDDAVDFLIKISKKNKLRGEILNLGSGKKTTIYEIYNILKKISGYKLNNVWGSMKNRIWDQEQWYADMNIVNKKLNWKTKTTIIEGLRKTYKWNKKYYYEY